MLTRRTFASLGLGIGAMAMLGGLTGCRDDFGTGEPIEASSIRSVRYFTGGGMTGGDESSELARQKDGSVTLRNGSREWHNSRERIVTYVLDESAFEQFAQIATDYNLRRASMRKQSDLVVLDAPTSSITFTMQKENGSYDIDKSFSISSQQELTDRDWEGWRAVVAALDELAASNEGVETLEPRCITFVANGVQYQFVSNDSVASEDLASRMPLTVVVENDGGGALVMRLDEPLEVGDTPAASGVAGTMCYDAAESAVLILYADREPTEGLHELAVSEYSWDAEYLADVESGEHTLYCSE